MRPHGTILGTVSELHRYPVKSLTGERVPAVTVDQLADWLGRDVGLIKIDVEGFEVDVLSGLSHPLPALSFEYLPAAHDLALAALDRLEGLGDYRYNYSVVETMRFTSHQWLDAAGLSAVLDRHRPLGRSGDVYARLVRCDVDQG